MNKENTWEPLNILFSTDNFSNKNNYAIFILNTKITWDPQFLLPLWTNASLRFTVDGGTNQWYKWLDEHKINRKTIPSPHYVTGDMDSIDIKILEIVRDDRNCSVIVTDDQNETDFTKALRQLENMTRPSKKPIETVIAVVDTSGRLDHILANINTMFKAKIFWPNVTIYQLADASLSWLLAPGRHRIYIPDRLREREEWCALLPVGDRCNHVTTTGLKWDLNNRVLRFGELVSSSNTYDEQPYVTVETDKPVLWSMGLNGLEVVNSSDG